MPAHGWLVVGGYDLRSAFRRPARWQLTLLECPATALIPRVGDAQLCRLDLHNWPAVRSVLLDQDGSVAERSTSTPAELLGHGSNAPLGLLRTVGTDRQLYLHIDSFADQARFLRLPPGRPVPAGDAIGELLSGLDRYSAKVSNHLGYRVNLQSDVQLGHTFSLLGAPDSYALARDTLTLASDGGLPGWLVEFREELRSSDLLHQVYAISDPPAEAGHVSFIPTSDGVCTVKRKVFGADERTERQVPITGDTVDYLRDVLGLIAAGHTSYRRTRHEIDVESIETGNVYAISYDRSTIVNDAGLPLAGHAELRQCEIEYRYSQSLGTVDHRSVRRDLAILRGLLAGYFDQRGIGHCQRHEARFAFLGERPAAA